MQIDFKNSKDMVIVGAKGFAKEVLEILYQQGKSDEIAFFDDVNTGIGDALYGRFPILKNQDQVRKFFSEFNNAFTLGIGNPLLRLRLSEKLKGTGGMLSSTISPLAQIGSFDVKIGHGSNILPNAILSNSTVIGKGCIVYYNVTVTHDCIVGDFVELSPGVTLLGRCKVGNFTQIGAHATVLPDIRIGENVVIGAGSVVTKDVESNSLMVGVPARKIKSLPALTY